MVPYLGEVMTISDLETFFNAYVKCALWAEADSAGDYSAADVDAGSLASMRADCDAFVENNKNDLVNLTAEQAGHDFWLTRNGHGAGFWDRGLGAIGDRLTEASKSLGDCNVYVGDDGRLYVESF
jgi:hypothetical protein